MREVMKVLLLLIFSFQMYSVEFKYIDNNVYFMYPASEDIGFGIHKDEKGNWKSINQQNLKEIATIQIDNELEAEIGLLVTRITHNFKPINENISGRGFRSLSIVFGNSASNITVYVGWNDKMNINCSDDVNLLLIKLKLLAQQVDAPEPASPAR